MERHAGTREVAHHGQIGAGHAVASVSTTTASTPREPEATAIATATPMADTRRDGRSTVAAAYVRPSASRSAAPSAAPVRARVARASVTSLRSSGSLSSDTRPTLGRRVPRIGPCPSPLISPTWRARTTS